MIPRRRIPLGLDTLVEMARCPFVPWERADRDVDRFERAFAAYLGSDYARATASGREAMTLILDGLGLQAGDELIIPAYTLGELLPLIQARGILPRAADVDPQSFNVSAATLARQIGPRTRALMVVHLHGAPCDMAPILELARAHGLRVIEDCAHALGAEVGGRKVGTFGDAALFSLEVNKALPTYGGGMVVSADPGVRAAVEQALAGRARREWPALRKALFKCAEELLIRSPLYGPLARLLFSDRFARPFERLYRGLNGRVRGGEPVAYSGFQARLGLKRLPGLDARNRRLNRLAERLARRLPEELAPQRRGGAGPPAFFNFTVRCREADAAGLRSRFQRRGVDAGIRSEVMDDTAALLGQTDCPEARRLYHQALLLPLYDGLDEQAFQQLCIRLNRPPPEEDALDD